MSELTFSEPISKELELTEQQIIKNRCELLSFQVSQLQKMYDEMEAKNKKMETLLEQLYEQLSAFEYESSSGESASESESEDENEKTLNESLLLEAAEKK
jgi:hypothetical protein